MQHVLSMLFSSKSWIQDKYSCHKIIFYGNSYLGSKKSPIPLPPENPTLPQQTPPPPGRRGQARKRSLLLSFFYPTKNSPDCVQGHPTYLVHFLRKLFVADKANYLKKDYFVESSTRKKSETSLTILVEKFSSKKR